MSKLFDCDPPATATEALQEWFSNELSAIVEQHWRMRPNHCAFIVDPRAKHGMQGLELTYLVDGETNNYVGIRRHRITASIDVYDDQDRFVDWAIARHHPPSPVISEAPIVIKWENSDLVTSECISDTTRLFGAIAQFRAAHRELFNQAFEEDQEL